jgi:hypothetical protein
MLATIELRLPLPLPLPLALARALREEARVNPTSEGVQELVNASRRVEALMCSGDKRGTFLLRAAILL